MPERAGRPASGLADRGRLILPLTAAGNFVSLTAPDLMAMRRGAVFRIERQGRDFLARAVSPVGIFPCAGARDEASERALAAGFDNDGWKRVTRLYRRDDLPDERCWVKAPGWCLAYD